MKQQSVCVFVFDTYTRCIWAEYTVYMYEIHGVYGQNTWCICMKYTVYLNKIQCIY